jgi:hypothetical protein
MLDDIFAGFYSIVVLSLVLFFLGGWINETSWKKNS